METRSSRKKALKSVLPDQADYKAFVLSDQPYDLSPSDSDQSSFHMVADDVLLRIITYLSIKQRFGIERVCRRWQALVHHSFTSMKCLVLGDDMVGQKHCVQWPHFYKLLVLSGPSLRVLKILDGCFPEEMTLPRIGQLCPSLLEIELNFVDATHYFTCKSIEEFSQYCPGLKSFIVRNTSFFFKESLCALLTNFRSLEHLGLFGCERLTGSYLKYLPNSIKELHLGPFLRIRTTNLHHIPTCCPNLEVLNVSGIECCPPWFFQELKKNCPKLRSLEVDLYQEFLFIEIINLKCLKALSMNFGDCESMLWEYLTELPLLECLDVQFDDLFSPEIDVDFSSIKNLKKLSFGSIYTLNVTSLYTMIECTKLEEFSAPCMFQQNNIPTNFLLKLVESCPALKKVYMDCLPLDMPDFRKLKELIKKRTCKLVIISNAIHKEVFEAEYNTHQLELKAEWSCETQWSFGY